MSLETKIIALAQAIGGDVKLLKAANGDLTSLSTTAKNNLVSAVNEIYTMAQLAGVSIIDDAAGLGATDLVWSVDKIISSIAIAKQEAKNELVDGAGAALDTFKEFAIAINNDPSFAATIATDLANRVRYDAVQTLTVPQKLQACTNIGIGDPEHNFVTDYNTAKA